MSGSRLHRWLAMLIAAAAIGPTRLAAQDSVVVIRPNAPDTAPQGALPPEVIQQLIAGYNDSLTTRIGGSFSVPAGSAITGRVAVYRGTLRVLGRIEGQIMVINGDLVVGPGGTVVGPVLVVGGRIDVRTGGTLTGEKTSYDMLAPVYRLPNGLLSQRERHKQLADLASARTSFQTGSIRTTLSLETGKTFNRIEGLPIVFGPSFQTQGASAAADARLDARAIFRPTTDRTKLRDNIGFVVSTEWRGGGSRRWFGFGGSGYRRILSIEDQPLSAGESGWSAFLLQQDYRDYYEARGIEGFGYVEPIRRLRIGFSLRRDLTRSVPASDPLSVFRNQDTWRPNPLIDDGHYRTARLSLNYDTRNGAERPTSGWLVAADYERSRSDDASPVALPVAVRDPIAPGRYQFSKLRFDIRRYARFDSRTRVNVRIKGDGWIDGDPLPVQSRVSLGGPDILPGYGFRSLNCAPSGFVDPAQASLCDRMLAAQIEIHRNLPVSLPFRIRNGDIAALQQILGITRADLVVMANTGKAWLSGNGPGRVPNDRIPNFDEWGLDIGAGVDAGGLGLYLARSLTDDRSFRFVVRLQRRF